MDEAGRGAWAGPLVAAAVVLPPGDLPGELLEVVRDSKTLSAERRERACQMVRAVAQGVGIGWVEAREIDSLGLARAGRLAMQRAVVTLPLPPSYLLIDAFPLPEVPLPQAAFPFADATCLSVAAASIVAKVARDRAMAALEQVHPGYGFARHKGYGTHEHRAALARLGPCAIHRRSYAPVRALRGE